MQISLTASKMALQVELVESMEWQVPDLPQDRKQYLFCGDEYMHLLQQWVFTLGWPQPKPDAGKVDVCVCF